MKFSSNEEISRLVTAFENRTLPKSEWTHTAHLAVGLYYCHQYPFDDARILVSNGIRSLNEAHGTANTDSSGYHETLTVFWLLTVNDFIRRAGRERPIFEIAKLLFAAPVDSNLPLRHYSRELLFSVHARHVYVEPDIEPMSVNSGGLLIERSRLDTAEDKTC